MQFSAAERLLLPLVLPGLSGHGKYLGKWWRALCCGVRCAVFDRHTYDSHRQWDVQSGRIDELSGHRPECQRKRAFHLGVPAAAVLDRRDYHIVRYYSLEAWDAQYFIVTTDYFDAGNRCERLCDRFGANANLSSAAAVGLAGAKPAGPL